MITMSRRTPLFDSHCTLGARCIDFGGWEMPVQYEGIAAEHHAVRKAAGLFDISHMGEIAVGGPHAAVFLDHALTNTATALALGEAQYSIMCNDQGGVIDDLYVYRIANEVFLLMVNATRIEADRHWLEFVRSSRREDRTVKIDDQSEQTGALALQGPATALFIDTLFSEEGLISVKHPTDLSKNQIDAFPFGGGEVFVARTGYTGEDGFEIIAPNKLLASLWDQLLEIGRPHGIQPAGLGARDTLRLEMGYPLYGHEISEDITPIEAGLSFFVKLDKDAFVGRSALARQKENGPERKLVAFKMTGKSPPPRQGYEIFVDEEELIHRDVWAWGPDGLRHEQDEPMIGAVTSGTQSPSLGCGIGMALIQSKHAQPSKAINIQIRKNFYQSIVCKKPVYGKHE